MGFQIMTVFAFYLQRKFCSDSRAALAALCENTTTLFVVWECMQVLGRLGEQNKVTLVWIPGQSGGIYSGQGRSL